jgi:LysR family positive regulator for ilvC
MDQKSMQVFLSVISTLNFSRTAVDMHMSVSAVSRCIARLEEELGQTLFDRDRRGMRPSSAARRLRPYAERVTTEWKALRHSFQDAASVSGELRIFCSVTASHRLLSPLMRAHRRVCPAVDVRLQTGDPADGLDRVRRGDADVAMIIRPASLPEAITFRAVATSQLELCLPLHGDEDLAALAQHSDAGLLPRLRGVPWVLPERGVTRELTDRWLRAMLDGEPEVYARVAGNEAIAAMVSLGLGVGIAPRIVVEAGAFTDALALRALPGLPELEIGLCARTGRMSDPVIAGFMDCVS